MATSREERKRTEEEEEEDEEEEGDTEQVAHQFLFRLEASA